MIQVSFWAKNHKWAARIIIIVSFILLGVSGTAAGLLLRSLEISVSFPVLLGFIVLYASGFLLYPVKRKSSGFYAFYRRQKIGDLLMVFSTFMMIAGIANQPGHLTFHLPSFSPASAAESTLPKDSAYKQYKSGKEFAAAVRDENGNLLTWKERKKMLKEQVRAIKRDPDTSPAAKVALIFLCVLLALGLAYLVAALACSLSCSGMVGGAIVVAVLGAGLIIWLTVSLIRSILGKKTVKKNPESAPDGP